MNIKNKKPVKQIEVNRTYYASGNKNGTEVSIPVQIIEIGEEWVKVKTKRQDIPDRWNQEVDLPVKTVKFYKL